MSLRNGRWMVCLAGALLVGACDRSPAPPPATRPAVPIPEMPPRPTTQELMDGKQIEMPLANLPLTATVPQSWSIRQSGPLTTLEGATPLDIAVIQLAQRDSILNETFDRFIQSLRRDQEDRGSGPHNRFEVRQLGSAKVIERAWAYKPMTSPQTDSLGMPILDAKGNPLTVTSTTMRWTLSVFIPGETAWAQYELNCIGMTTEQYDAEHELIRKVFAGVKLTSPAPATAPAAKP